VEQSWLAWAAAADDGDRHELALTLLDAMPPEQRDANTAVTQATLLLQTGQAGRAISILEGLGVTDLPDDRRASWPHLVLAAGRAAAGEVDAYRWLMSSAGRLSTAVDAWRVSYLVAVAATGIGDRTTADQAWHNIVVRHGIVTPASLAEFSAAQIAGRDRDEPTEATTTVAATVANLHHADVPIHQDPGPVLDAARALSARGDVAGARLLLHAARRRIPATPALDAALAAVTPTGGMRRHRILVTALWCLTPALLFLGMPGGLIVLAVRTAWERWIPIPGLNRADSAAWRAFRSVSYDPYTDPADPPAKDQSGYYGLAALLSLLFVAFPVTGLVPTLLAAMTRATGPDEVNPALIISIRVLLCIGIPVLSFLGSRQAHRWLRSRRHDRRRAAVRRAGLSGAQQCQCWQSGSMSGPLAVDYLHRHLQPEATTYLPPALRDNASLGRCAVTGAMWLGVRHGSHGTAVLLRGAVGHDEEPSQPTGFYL
jgi:hypothetical protein